MRLWSVRTEPAEGYVQCPYCGELVTLPHFSRHQKSAHDGFRQLTNCSPVLREDNPQDDVLRTNLEILGDPGGVNMGRFLQARDGFLLCYDEVKNITSYTYEIISPKSVHVLATRENTSWLCDPLLPLNCMVSTFNLKSKIPDGFHLGHLTPWIYHQHDEKEKRASSLVSNSCVQAEKLNEGPLSHVETAGRHIAAKLKTHCITGTIILDHDPILLDTPNQSPIPDAIYKIHVFEINPNTFYYDAYYFPNSVEFDKDPELARWSIGSINLLTGFNFLSNPGVTFYTKTDEINLAMILKNLTKEKDVTSLMNALKAKDEQLKAKAEELQQKELENQCLRVLLRQRHEQLKPPAAKKARKN